MTTAWMLTCLGLMILPGPDMALVTKQSLSRGWRGGALVVIGIYLSFLLYSVAIIAGLIPILNSWPEFFVLARWAGGAYLIYLGIRGIQQALSAPELAAREQPSANLVASGFVSNALNAKQYLFLFLLLPAFLPTNPRPVDSLYLLLLLLLVSTVFWIVWIAALSGWRQRMAGHHRKIEIISSLALIIVGGLLLIGAL